MYPNLLGQKVYCHLTNDSMAQIIGVSRTAWDKKMQSGRFTVDECKALCTYFNKSFCYLFATDEEINQANGVN